MRVLVTGSTGFLGKRLCRRLSEKGWDVVGLGRRAWNSPEPSGFPYQQVQFDRPDSLSQVVEPGQSYVMVHLAWDITQRSSYVAQAECLLQFTKMLACCQSDQLQGIVAAGSADEFGSREGILAENATAGTLRSAYGWSKAAAFQLLADWCAKNETPGIWLRPFTIYGPGQSGNMLIPYAIRQAIQRQPAKFSAGTQQRDFVFVDDVVDAFVQAISRVGSGSTGCESYNIGSGSPQAVRDLLNQIAERLDARQLFQFGEIGVRPEEPQLIGANIELARQQLNWTAQTPLESGLEQLIEYASKELKCLA